MIWRSCSSGSRAGAKDGIWPMFTVRCPPGRAGSPYGEPSAVAPLRAHAIASSILGKVLASSPFASGGPGSPPSAFAPWQIAQNAAYNPAGVDGRVAVVVVAATGADVDDPPLVPAPLVPAKVVTGAEVVAAPTTVVADVGAVGFAVVLGVVLADDFEVTTAFLLTTGFFFVVLASRLGATTST